MNSTHDESRDLRRTRLILLSTLFCVGLTGCSLVLIWLIRYTRWNTRSARMCSLILNLIIANLSVYIFATGIQIFWEFQTNRQWPFNDFLCRVVKFFQSFSILSSTYIVVAMAIDRCIAILTPLKAGKIRVLYLCGTAWILAGILSAPNAIIFHLYVNGTVRHCTAVFNHQTSPIARRIYLTFISLVVYFIPFLVLVLSYTLIFIKLLCREHDQQYQFIHSTSLSSPSHRYSSSSAKRKLSFSKTTHSKSDTNSSLHHSPLNNSSQRKRVNTYAKARSKTFRMIIILVLFMIIFGAPYYCLELYIAYTGRMPSHLVLALAGGAAVAPSSIDPWIFLLFWTTWNEPASVTNRQHLTNYTLKQQQIIKSRKIERNNGLDLPVVIDPSQRQSFPSTGQRSSNNIVQWHSYV